MYATGDSTVAVSRTTRHTTVCVYNIMNMILLIVIIYCHLIEVLNYVRSY